MAWSLWNLVHFPAGPLWLINGFSLKQLTKTNKSNYELQVKQNNVKGSFLLSKTLPSFPSMQYPLPFFAERGSGSQSLQEAFLYIPRTTRCPHSRS